MSETKTKRRSPPSIKARVRGMYTQMREHLEKQFLDNNPGKRIRWAFDPEHERRLSKVRKHELAGYELVDAEAEGMEQIHGQQGSTVRLGDTVMMAIDKDEYEERKEELDSLAKEDARKSKKAYEDAVRGVRKGEHAARPIGDISSRNEEFVLKETED